MAVRRTPERLAGEDGMDEVEPDDDDGRFHSLTHTGSAEGGDQSPVCGSVDEGKSCQDLSGKTVKSEGVVGG